jgi:hypothetical protein
MLSLVCSSPAIVRIVRCKQPTPPARCRKHTPLFACYTPLDNVPPAGKKPPELAKLSSRLEITWHCPTLARSDAPQAERFRRSTFNALVTEFAAEALDVALPVGLPGRDELQIHTAAVRPSNVGRDELLPPLCHHCAGMPASCTTFFHLASSDLMKASNSSVLSG